MSADGYVLFEHCEDYEQALRIETGPDMPPAGVLGWRGNGQAATVFRTRQEARAAIERTHHWAKAFGREDYPEKRHCKVVAVRFEKGGAR